MPPLREAFPSCLNPSWDCSCHCRANLWLGHTLRWILSRSPWARGLLGVLLFGTSVCVQPSPTGLPASSRADGVSH